MPDSGQGQQDPQATGQNPSPPSEPQETEAEKNYWKRLESTIDGAIDKRIKALREGGTGEGQGTQRTGRVSLFDMFADWMGGPFKPPAPRK